VLFFHQISGVKQRKELDVDFIGGQGPLTKEEEKAISDFIKSQKSKKRNSQLKKSGVSKKLAA
jgi:hypothetical protein